MFYWKCFEVRLYEKKAIISGRFIEFFKYEKTIARDYNVRRRGGRHHKATLENAIINRGKVAYRARTKIVRYINANPYLDKFLTLTFADNVQDLDVAFYEFKKFRQRLKYAYPNFKYVMVVEFQKRGAIHFHVLCNLPYVDVNELAEDWSNGFIRLNRIDHVDNVGLYVSKYMSKDNIDERLVGRKCYEMCRGLNKPIEVADDNECDYILSSLDNVESVRTSVYETENNGICEYTYVRLAKSFMYVPYYVRKGLTRITDCDPFKRDKWRKIYLSRKR